MKEAFWGVFIVLLGLLGVLVINLAQTATVDNDRVYYLIKESTEAATYDAIDLTYYRLNADIRIVRDKFVENLTRRFAENVTIGDYTIVVQDINEVPPKVSLGISSGISSMAGEKFYLGNRLDAVIETKYKLNDVLSFLRITESEWNRYNVKPTIDVTTEGKTVKVCKPKMAEDNMQCIDGDLAFLGFSNITVSPFVCYSDKAEIIRIFYEKSRKAKYKECECGKWVVKEEETRKVHSDNGNELVWNWSFKKSSDIRTIQAETTDATKLGPCAQHIYIMVPKNKNTLMPKNNNNNNEQSKDNSNYERCTAAGIRIPIDTKVMLHSEYDPRNAVNRILKWTSSDSSKVSVMASNPRPMCTLNAANTNCLSKGLITAKGIGEKITIKAETEYKNNKQYAQCNITVWDGSPDTMSCKNLEIYRGSTVTMESSYTPANASKTNFTFKSLNTNIATISGNKVNGVEEGTATIEMTETHSGKKTTCTIKVKVLNIEPSTNVSSGNSGAWIRITYSDGTYKDYGTIEQAEKDSRINQNGGAGTISYMIPGVKIDVETLTVTKDGSTNKQITVRNITEGQNKGDYTETIIQSGYTDKVTTKKNGVVTTTGGEKIKTDNNSGNSNCCTTTPNAMQGDPRYKAYCFTAGTLVKTINGYENIENIKEGDLVLSYNFDTNKQEYRLVTKKYIHDDNNEDLYEIYYDDGVIEVTSGHPIYVNNVINIKKVKDLKVGDYLLGSDGKKHIVTNIKHYRSEELVYNIQVENNNNYYVGNGILVDSGRQVK